MSVTLSLRVPMPLLSSCPLICLHFHCLRYLSLPVSPCLPMSPVNFLVPLRLHVSCISVSVFSVSQSVCRYLSTVHLSEPLLNLLEPFLSAVHKPYRNSVHETFNRNTGLVFKHIVIGVWHSGTPVDRTCRPDDNTRSEEK